MLHKTISILTTMFLLTGCAELFLKPYGNVASDAENVHVGIVSLPEGAPTISQGYNPRPETDSEAAPGAGHEGIDIYARTGTPIIAPASGIVIDSYHEPFYGNQIVIDHGRDKNGRFLQSRHLHLDTRLVAKGDVVIRGEKIGTLGSSGILASYPHLHFEIRAKTSPNEKRSFSVNPHLFWFDGAGVVTCFDKSKEWPDIPFKTTYPVQCR